MTVIFGRLLQKLRHKNQRVFKVVIQTWHRWLKRALQLRLYANINEDEIIVDGNTLIYRTLDCRVQNARKRKGMEFHPARQSVLLNILVLPRPLMTGLSAKRLAVIRK